MTALPPERRTLRKLQGAGLLAIAQEPPMTVLYSIEVFATGVPGPDGAVVNGPPDVFASFAPSHRRTFAQYIGKPATLTLEDPLNQPWECVVLDAHGRLGHRGGGPLPGTPRTK